mmetsp:Transcript_39418/g.122256  ORF Transcript_39418/g.122256 Transcript_39418/m.122256 type:complete len:440 (+) Transcript_39418:3-1322(+)
MVGAKAARARGPTRGRAFSPEEVLEKIHTTLHTLVGEAATSVLHHEKTWSQSELTKRIVRYIYNSAKNSDLFSLPWEEATRKFISHAMSCYASACQDRVWFYELDLVPAFAAAAWEVANASGQPKVRFSELQDLVIQEVEGCLDDTLLVKALWDAVQRVFVEDTARSKVYNALQKTHQPALTACNETAGHLPDLKRVQVFVKKWLEDSMSRAWSALEHSERALTEATVLRLFQHLVAPFGDDHPYSCVPAELIKDIGKPPRDWDYLHEAVKKLFDAWRHESLTSGGSKKRKARGGNGDEGIMAPAPSQRPRAAVPEPPMQAFKPRPRTPVPEPPVQKARAPAPRRQPSPEPMKDEEEEDSLLGEEPDLGAAQLGEAGHPDCTSEEDCIGLASNSLVRHILEGNRGDIYCQTCWESFLQQNHSLEGVWEDGPTAGEPYSG